MARKMFQRFRNGALIAACLFATLTNALPALAQTVQDVQVGTQTNGATGLGFSTNSATNPIYTAAATTSGNQQVVGNVASGVADSGNPVKVGCVRNTSAPTPANGQRVDCQADASGDVLVAPVGSTGAALLPNAAALSDSLPNPSTTEIGANTLYWDSFNSVWRRWSGNYGTNVNAANFPQVGLANYNGASMDLQFNNTPSVAVGITCAACTSTQTGSDQTNFNGRGVRCTYDATIVTSVGSFTVEIDGKDEVSGKYYSLLTTTAVSTVSTNILTVYPGVTPVSSAPNFATSIPVPRIWRVKATFNSGTNQTFTIGCNTLV